MQQKILEIVFITKKFTQCKTSRTLKIDLFETPDNKNIGKLFSRYEIFSWTKLILVLIHLKYWYCNFPIPRLSLPPSSFSVKFYSSQPRPSSTKSSWCFSLVSLFCTTAFDHTPPQVLDVPNRGWNMLPIKNLSLLEQFLLQS